VVGTKLGTLELSDTGDRRLRVRPLLATIYSNFFIYPCEELGPSTATTPTVPPRRGRVPQGR
jgi:hypothetical protein